MKHFLRLVILVASFCTCSASMADVKYSFNGFYGGRNPDAIDHTGVFTLVVSDYLVADADFLPSAMANCHASDLMCSNVHFFHDAHAAGLTNDPGVQAIRLSDTDGTQFFYYFSAPAFSTPGTYGSLYGFNPATVTVSTIPEPASVFSLLAGLGLIGALAVRRRRA